MRRALLVLTLLAAACSAPAPDFTDSGGDAEADAGSSDQSGSPVDAGSAPDSGTSTPDAGGCAGSCLTDGTLPALNVSPDDVSVSGISSGGFLAVQLHVAYSATIRRGAGIVAGGPDDCSQGQLFTALGPCMQDSGSRNLPHLLSVIDGWSQSGAIDSTSHLGSSKAWLFSGTRDTVVRQPVMDDLQRMYAHYLPAGAIQYKNDVAAEHGFPTDSYGNACGLAASPWVIDCGFDAAGALLQWLYGSLQPKTTGALSGTLVRFAQAPFWGDHDPTKHGMAADGWAYVPARCASGAKCRLHVALHGCQQDAASVGDAFYAHAGFNPWADANDLVVLYPQAAATSANPQGCWDWWGYDDRNFAVKAGGQMVAVKTMIDRLVSGDAQSPFTCAHWNDTNRAHVAAGRAYVANGNVYATGSNQLLGPDTANATSDVRETASGFFAYGTCL